MKRRSKNWDKSYYHRPNRARGWSPVVIIVSVLMHSPIIKVKRTKLRTDDRVRWGMRNRRRRCKGWMENNFAWVRSVERSLLKFCEFFYKSFFFHIEWAHAFSDLFIVVHEIDQQKISESERERKAKKLTLPCAQCLITFLSSFSINCSSALFADTHSNMHMWQLDTLCIYMNGLQSGHI